MGTPSFVLTVALLALAASLYFKNARPSAKQTGRQSRVVMVPRDPVMPANEAAPSSFAPVVVTRYAGPRAPPQPAYARTSATTGVRY